MCGAMVAAEVFLPGSTEAGAWIRNSSAPQPRRITLFSASHATQHTCSCTHFVLHSTRNPPTLRQGVRIQNEVSQGGSEPGK